MIKLTLLLSILVLITWLSTVILCSLTLSLHGTTCGLFILKEEVSHILFNTKVETDQCRYKGEFK